MHSVMRLSEQMLSVWSSWSNEDILDLRLCLTARSSSIEQAARALKRDVVDVRMKAEDLGLWGQNYSLPVATKPSQAAPISRVGKSMPIFDGTDVDLTAAYKYGPICR